MVIRDDKNTFLILLFKNTFFGLSEENCKNLTSNFKINLTLEWFKVSPWTKRVKNYGFSSNKTAYGNHIRHSEYFDLYKGLVNCLINTIAISCSNVYVNY